MQENEQQLFRFERRKVNPEGSRARANRKEVTNAGFFLDKSGIADSILDFSTGFLGEMGKLKGEIGSDQGPNGTEVAVMKDIKNDREYSVSGAMRAKAGIVVEWVLFQDSEKADPTENNSICSFTVTAYKDSRGDRFLAASFTQTDKYNKRTTLHVKRLYFPDDFNYSDPVTEEDRNRYQEWLRGTIIDFGLMWGEH